MTVLYKLVELWNDIQSEHFWSKTNLVGLFYQKPQADCLKL